MRSGVPALALMALAAFTLLAANAAAQPYEVSWWTVDGGGATGAGGPYMLTGTSGQPDAGGPFAGGPYSLHSGFWSLAAGGAIGPQADLGDHQDGRSGHRGARAARDLHDRGRQRRTRRRSRRRR